MILKIRQCCCSLSTFVKIVCIVLLVLYFCVGLASVFWFLFFENNDPTTVVGVAEKEDGEINGFEEFDINDTNNVNKSGDDSFRKIVIFSIILIFAMTGAMANLLVLLSIRVCKRSLIIPWLVYHTGVIIGKSMYQ